MDSITIENFRCFGARQTVPLAPLTLLVGPNSTGKTSFMALVRALWDVAFHSAIPNFVEDPYNLGSFQDIVHRRHPGETQIEEFSAGFQYSSHEAEQEPVSFSVTFENRTGTPYPTRRVVSQNDLRFEVHLDTDDAYGYKLNWDGGEWSQKSDANRSGRFGVGLGLLPLPVAIWESTYTLSPVESEPIDDNNLVIQRVRREGLPDVQSIERMVFNFWNPDGRSNRPFASAPIRSRPRRTYDPIRVSQDPEGEYIPSYLASLSRRHPQEWDRIKGALESFGRDSELFEEISIRPLGNTDGDPFQLLIRLPGEDGKTYLRNLVDVGYGVSQSLPVLTELLSDNAPATYLLQQPEVHLHPIAQAALGSLFCRLVSNDMRLMVETHSDYLLDRIRSDVRDLGDQSSLKPQDVMILYFERSGSDVRIHPIGIDDNGNVRAAPDSYGDFFMSEARRTLGL